MTISSLLFKSILIFILLFLLLFKLLSSLSLISIVLLFLFFFIISLLFSSLLWLKLIFALNLPIIAVFCLLWFPILFKGIIFLILHALLINSLYFIFFGWIKFGLFLTIDFLLELISFWIVFEWLIILLSSLLFCFVSKFERGLFSLEENKILFNLSSIENKVPYFSFALILYCKILISLEFDSELSLLILFFGDSALELWFLLKLLFLISIILVDLFLELL